MSNSRGTLFVLPKQSFYTKPTLSSGFKVQPGRAKQSFYTTGASTAGRKVYFDPECEGTHKQGVQADADGLFPPIYLDPDGSSEYRSVLTALLDNGSSTTDLYTLDSIPRYRENLESDTFTVTWSGFSANPSATTATYVRIGRIVFLALPGSTGTSSSTSFALTGVPSTIRPDTVRYIHLPFAIDNGSWVGAAGQIRTDGQIDFAPSNAAYNEAGWTATGNKGLSDGATTSYVWCMYRLFDS